MPDRAPDPPDADRWRTRSDEAHVRGARAADRVAELRRRQDQLHGGQGATVRDVAAARAAAADGVRLAREALERALRAHELAAQAHERVAEYLENLAAQGGRNAERWAAKAARHRVSAAADREAEAEAQDAEDAEDAHQFRGGEQDGDQDEGQARAN